MSVCQPVIARYGKILKNSIYSIVMYCSGIGSELTEFYDRIEQLCACRDHGPNQFSNRSMVSDSSAVEFRTLGWLERFCRIQSTGELIGWVEYHSNHSS
jgi:hypothetical protein